MKKDVKTGDCFCDGEALYRVTDPMGDHAYVSLRCEANSIRTVRLTSKQLARMDEYDPVAFINAFADQIEVFRQLGGGSN